MEKEIRKLAKDGEFKFYDGPRLENTKKAFGILEEAENLGYKGYKVYSNSFGYIVRLEG